MNILYTSDNNFVPQIAAAICSVCENNRDVDEINFYLFAQEITKKNIESLSKFVESYKRNLYVIELDDLRNYFDFDFDTAGWRPIVLARLLLDRLLPEEVERLIYLDGDTIVRGSLVELWETDMHGLAIGASTEPTVGKDTIEILELGNYPYINAGVLLIDLKMWREQHLGDRIIGYYRDKKGQLFANDQDAINGAMKGEIYILSPKYNFYNMFFHYPYRTLKKLSSPAPYIDKETYQDALNNPIIIHYLGEERPWRKGNKHRYKNDYKIYLTKTPWADTKDEEGWELYFVCWRIFNMIMKLFPMLRYYIIRSLIPVFMNYRKQKLNKK